MIIVRLIYNKLNNFINVTELGQSTSPWTHYSSEEETQITQLKIPDPEILKQPYQRNMTSKTDSKKLVPVKAAAAAEVTTTAPVSIKFRKPEVKPNADEDAYTPEFLTCNVLH